MPTITRSRTILSGFEIEVGSGTADGQNVVVLRLADGKDVYEVVLGEEAARELGGMLVAPSVHLPGGTLARG